MVGQMMGGGSKKKSSGLLAENRSGICFESGAKFIPKSLAEYLLKGLPTIKVAWDTFEVKLSKTATQFLATLPSFSENP